MFRFVVAGWNSLFDQPSRDRVANSFSLHSRDYVSPESKRILVVDDFPEWRSFMGTLLNLTQEWKIIGEASDGAEAVRKTTDLQPDLVLLDVDLPTMNGFEVARQIKVAVPGVKIVFVAAENSREMALAALDAGALGYVLKSQVVSELLLAINSAFNDERFVSKGIALSD
jgi:DNA-binding NarL/FixJ family response regulator